MLHVKVVYRCISTIYALSSGRGPAGVAVVRISGPAAALALKSLAGFPDAVNESSLKPRYAHLRRISNPTSGHLIDKGLVLWFPKPNSFTGEDVVEFHVHGGPAVVKSIFSVLSTFPDYRMAEPGEFMRRSFNNGKIDLGGAEAVADLISAETEAQHLLAVNQIDRTQERLDLYAKWRQSILSALASVEAWIDFSDSDEIEDDVMERARCQMAELAQEIRGRTSDARRGQRLREGIHAAIIGPPNAGKSSLMNALCRDDEVSIVSPIAGTTRDVIERPCDIAGFPIILVDTAGLRLETDDPIEKIGVERSKARADVCDLLVFVVDATEYQHVAPDKLTDPSWLSTLISKFLINRRITNESSQSPVIIVFNKIDLLPKKECFPKGAGFVLPETNQRGVICSLSLHSFANFDTFLSSIAAFSEELCGFNGISRNQETPLISGIRQAQHLTKAAELLQSFVVSKEGDVVIGADYLRQAVRELGKLTGEITTEDVLDQIFRTFCIGK